jgi:gliding motility-associated-like protein
MNHQNKMHLKQGAIIACISLILTFHGIVVNAQIPPPNDDCNNAQVLCLGDTVKGTTVGATNDFASECILSNPAVWYTFTTNSDRNRSVKVNVIRDPLCSIPGTTGDSLQGVILQSTDPLADPCADPSLFLEVSDTDTCAIGDSIFNIILPAALPSTQYWVQIGAAINDQGMPTSCQFKISISGNPVNIYAGGPVIKILRGAGDTIHGAGPDPGTFTWAPTTGLKDVNTLTPFASPNETTLYTLTGDIGECMGLTDDVRVIVDTIPIHPTTIFTPNGDGFNDTWQINGIQDFPKSSVEVFNRWGQRVFISIGYDNEWDGTNNGTEVPEGNYFWVILLNRSDLQITNTVTGSVAIAR